MIPFFSIPKVSRNLNNKQKILRKLRASIPGVRAPIVVEQEGKDFVSNVNFDPYRDVFYIDDKVFLYSRISDDGDSPPNPILVTVQAELKNSILQMNWRSQRSIFAPDPQFPLADGSYMAAFLNDKEQGGWSKGLLYTIIEVDSVDALNTSEDMMEIQRRRRSATSWQSKGDSIVTWDADLTLRSVRVCRTENFMAATIKNLLRHSDFYELEMDSLRNVDFGDDRGQIFFKAMITKDPRMGKESRVQHGVDIGVYDAYPSQWEIKGLYNVKAVKVL